jgi:hypothetical protein
MSEKYNQQDGSPNPRPDSGEAVPDPNNARPAVVGERSTQENIGGQGLGQYKDKEDKQGGAVSNPQPAE